VLHECIGALCVVREHMSGTMGIEQLRLHCDAFAGAGGLQKWWPLLAVMLRMLADIGRWARVGCRCRSGRECRRTLYEVACASLVVIDADAK